MVASSSAAHSALSALTLATVHSPVMVPLQAETSEIVRERSETKRVVRVIIIEELEYKGNNHDPW